MLYPTCITHVESSATVCLLPRESPHLLVDFSKFHVLKFMPCAGKLCIASCVYRPVPRRATPPPNSSVSLPHTQLLATTDLFPIFTVLPFPERHINGILPYAGFLVWLSSLSRMHLIFTEMLQELAVLSFFLVDGVPSSRSTAVCLFTC